MKNQFKMSMVAAAVIAAGSTGVYAEEGVSSTVDVSFRYRIETVDQESMVEDAQASTLRTRATIKTKWNDKFDSVLEFDDVTEIGMDEFNAGQGNTPDRSQYPVVADPEGTEVNQAFVRYNGDSTKVAYGRQRILIENQRFVGGVGWRQNEQTYDGLTVNTKFGEVNFNYAYVSNVNRIFGEDVDAGDHEHNTHLINADMKLGDGKLSGYYFAIENETAQGASNDTFGVRYSGKAGTFAYTAELATQSAGSDNPNDYDASYYLLEGAYKPDGYSIGAGIEVLGGDSANGQGFTTSLATLHKFQGWADVFLGTPASGIEDMYLNGSVKLGEFNLKAVYHTFATDEGGVDLGTEFDLALSRKINKKTSMLIKYASFDSDNELLYSSRDKMWFMLTYKL
ncbi:alginate export family protein [Aliikangiella sp. G2MR2-5]|uniref:alginate export family protein n=1 Tax=Aliikangiella sp. G2MR2-5 TaxID=2788943 RepID=UPI0018A9BE27|nr:alginate export family protein [Aliikangiella sp. G2MR2-5]